MARQIFVVKAFNLLLNEVEMAAAGATSPLLRFAVGRHDVPEVIAEHPQTKAHSSDEAGLGAVLSHGAGAPAVTGVPQAEHDAVLGELSNLRVELDAKTSEAAGHAAMVESLRVQVRMLTEAKDRAVADVDEANAQVRAMSARLAGAQGVAADEAVGDLTVRHKGRGQYAVFRGDDQLTEAMSKDAADTKALELATEPTPPETPQADTAQPEGTSTEAAGTPPAEGASETPPAA